MSPPLPPERDETLAEVLRLGGAAVRLDGVDWDRLHQVITSRARSEQEQRTHLVWWEAAAQRRRLTVAASLAAILGAARLARGRSADPRTRGAALMLPSESIALAHLVQVTQEEEGFTALIRASGGDLFTAWTEP